jgi:hypothetical protein
MSGYILRPDCFSLGTPLSRRLGGPQTRPVRLDEDKTLLNLPEFEPRTVHDYNIFKYITKNPLSFFYPERRRRFSNVFHKYFVEFCTTLLNGLSFPDRSVLPTDPQLTANVCLY